MEIKLTTTGDQLVIALEGRLDTTTAPQLTQIYPAALAGIAHLILDFDGLDFVSSAGLRALLIAQKQMNKQGDMVVRHVSPTVMDVFEMTGFSDILTIEKDSPIREIQLDTTKVLGQGANGAVYQYKEDSIVKIYFRDSALEEIEREKTMAREALILGVPTAISLGIVMSDGKYGLEYEFIKSRTMAGEMHAHPEKVEALSAQFVELAKILHTTPHQMGKRPSQFPSIQNIMLDRIQNSDRLNEEERTLALDFVRSIPQGDTLVHGDFHPGNVMMSGDEPLIIDIADITYGHPIFDLCYIHRALLLFGRIFLLDSVDDMTVVGMTFRENLALWDYFIAHYFPQDMTPQAKADALEQVQALIGLDVYLTIHQAPFPPSEKRNAIVEELFREGSLPYLKKHTGNVNW